MKTTLADFLSPRHDHYRSLGELAATLRMLMETAHPYRYKGRWGSAGPTEELNNHSGCTNSHNTPWSSSRLHQGMEGSETTTWRENHDAIHKCILAALCSSYEAWRKKCNIDLYMPIKIPMAYQQNDKEREAWDKIMALHKFQLPIPTMNSCHKRVNILAAPELVVSRSCIRISVSVTDKYELRTSPRCYSRWNADFLAGVDGPQWNCGRETFSLFLLRAVQYYKSIQPRKKAL